MNNIYFASFLVILTTGSLRYCTLYWIVYLIMSFIFLLLCYLTWEFLIMGWCLGLDIVAVSLIFSITCSSNDPFMENLCLCVLKLRNERQIHSNMLTVIHLGIMWMKEHLNYIPYYSVLSEIRKEYIPELSVTKIGNT